ncbi:peptidoglycan recognition protein family protein [Streptomyces albipurpureus]|uniref:N-acetylmuramoyl-L-alanine amidase n=1 Tax=Streptomyces albipurpureus TaxID=2897419 RepID=A0ABT0UN88_9ACTN|nr:N-acetylmuramoyl-L-alanine amidase [Streptomyces sp. CWNU-1]MCM2390073.1 N-acetylmuramoyl-L-alanine amidase [Streptomyces sp. CWNU-1]
MRGFPTSSIGAAACAALVLPLSISLTAPASAEPPPVAPPHIGPALPGGVAASDSGVAGRSLREPDPGVSGSTRSLPLSPAMNRSLGPTGERGLRKVGIRPFSLVGVVWDDPAAELAGTVQVRTRPLATGNWSRWQDVEAHTDGHGADPGTAEGASERTRGATAPLWVGASDGVEVRVRPTDAHSTPLPDGMRLELVDPGADPTANGPVRSRAVPAMDEPASPLIPDASYMPDLSSVWDLLGGPTAPAPPAQTAEAAAKSYIGPRPKIITRKGWGADESLREKGFVYTSTVKAAFVHHSATGNSYTCKQAPSVLRSIYRYHVVSTGWRDFGYNFAIDKCGNIYEGRAGGVNKPVLGAHTLGFNTNSMGIALLGTYSHTNPPAAAVTAAARLTAWKLGVFKRNPKGKVTLTSGGSGKHAKGKKVSFYVIAGHRNAFLTDCPGSRLYGKLGAIRTASAGYQGRS